MTAASRSARVLVILALVAAVRAGKHDSYSGCSVHSIQLRDSSDAELLHALETSLQLDVWQHGVAGVRDAHVMVAPEGRKKFLDALDRKGVKHSVKIDDVARNLEQFDEQLSTYRASRSGREAIPFEDYPTHEEVNSYLERIAATFPDVATLITVGNSFEGRPIKYLKISTTNFTDTSKPVYFMDATIHAREWVTTPVALYCIHRLTEGLRDEDRDLLEGTDWIIYPVVNPDGYEWTQTNERLWRRTRSVNPLDASACLGVDANRNFDVAFNTVGVSQNPCAQNYPGVTPFSEPETRYIRDLLYEHLPRVQLYVNIHSYGNWVLFGRGFNSSTPANAAQLHHVGAVMGAAIDAHMLDHPFAQYYRVGNSAMLLYASSGSAQDYAQDIGVPFSYTLELPGYNYLFQVPPQYIAQINGETWPGIAASARLAKLHYSARINN